MSKDKVNYFHRPQYHFLPPANWMNDPNGPLYWNEEYHLFFQYNPEGPYHNKIHWGHAVSEDLVHWEILPIALAPSPEGPDKDGVWSGCAVIKNSVPTILYTGVKPEVQCLATATSEDLINWEKYEDNPIIEAPPKDLNVTGFRDPFVWREDGMWYMVLGSGIEDVGGTILLYRSHDLRNWEYLHPLFSENKEETGTMWECPNFFKLEDKYVLVVSPYDKVTYWIGEYRDHKFIPEKKGFLDLGQSYYAPNCLVDNKDRRIMWGWVQEERSEKAQRKDGWSGVMSLPRRLYINQEGNLGMKPVEELKNLRRNKTKMEEILITPDSSGILNQLQGDKLEIVAEFIEDTASSFGLLLYVSSNQEEFTIVEYDTINNTLTVNTKNSSLAKNGEKKISGGIVKDKRDKKIKLHVFLDKSVIEIFANESNCLTSRVYPSREDSISLDVFSKEGNVMLKTINVWTLNSIWE